MMRAMREITKPVFWVVAITFIGWMAYGQITDIVGGGKDVVLSVDGTIVRSQPFQQQYQATLEQYRRQQGGGRLTREDERQVQDRVADQFIQKILLERAYRRFGIPVSDAELERYYALHQADFKRRAAAWLSYVELPRVPSAADSAAALAHARALRAEIARGKAKFDDVAKRESADSGTAARGGDLGWVKRNGSGFVAPFAAALRRLAPGVLSEPVLTEFGYHVIRVDSVKGDSLRVRHILAPIVLHGAHLDAVDARTDTLDRLAADQTDGSHLDSAAHRLGLPLAHASKLVQGERLTLGTSTIPDVSVWAFEARPGETSPVIDAAQASYVFRLDSLEAAGVPPLVSIRARVLAAARFEKKKVVARDRADQTVAALRDAGDLLAAGRARGYRVEKLGPFTRVTAPVQFARDPLVLGAAFGLRRGERSGVIADETGWFVLQGLTHVDADSAAWLKQREQQREALLRPVEQARLQQFIAALRADAKIVDRRSELFRPAAASES